MSIGFSSLRAEFCKTVRLGNRTSTASLSVYVGAASSPFSSVDAGLPLLRELVTSPDVEYASSRTISEYIRY